MRQLYSLLGIIITIILNGLFISSLGLLSSRKVCLIALIEIILFCIFYKNFCFYLMMMVLFTTIISQTVDYNWFVESLINYFKKPTWVCYYWSLIVDDAYLNRHTSALITAVLSVLIFISTLVPLKYFYKCNIITKPIQNKHYQMVLNIFFIVILFYFHYEYVINYIIPPPPVNDFIKHLNPIQKKKYNYIQQLKKTI